MKNMLTALPLLALLLSPQASLAQSQMTAPPAPPSVRQIHDLYIESVDPADKQAALHQLAITTPSSGGDVDALYDLFMRFSDEQVRHASLASLERLNPAAQSLEPMALRALQDEDPASVIFGIKLALRLRSPAALPVIEKLAKPKIKHKQASDIMLISQRNAWWLQYEALAALAQWKGVEALPLLERRAKEAPSVASLIATYLWPHAIPLISDWAKADAGTDAAARAKAALDAPVPAALLRATRARMLEALRDPKAPLELRHRFAIKIGLSSVPDEVPALLKEHADAKDPVTRKLFAAAAFATRDMSVVPLLSSYSKEDPDPIIRAGARVQLKDMLPAGQYRGIIEWAQQNDPDPENRAAAQRELQTLR